MRIPALLLAAAVSLVFASTTHAQKKLVVGFSQIGSESGWRAAETKVSKIEAEKRGIDLRISDAQQRQENQIKAIRSFVAQGVSASSPSAISIACCSSPASP